MKKLCFCIIQSIVIFLYFDTASPQTENILPNVLTLEFSFGDDNLPDEFLLARPSGIVVLNNGDILVTDESSMKIYTSDGKSKTILGREGVGPEEFKGSSKPYLSLEGYLAVDAGQHMYNFYDPELDPFRKINYTLYEGYDSIKKKYGMYFGFLDKLILVDTDSYIYIIRGAGFENKKNANLIVSKMEEVTKVVAENEVYEQALGGNFGMPVHYQSRLMLEQLPDKRIVYAGGNEHKYEKDGNHYYTIKISDYEGNIIEEINCQYDRLKIPESRFDSYRGDNVREGMEAAAKQMLRILEEYPYCPPLQDLKVDGNYIFTFTYSTNDNEEILTDIFDGSTGEYLRSAYFSVIPRYIKNRKAYFIRREQDTFPTVEVYRIDPRVYDR